MMYTFGISFTKKVQRIRLAWYNVKTSEGRRAIGVLLAMAKLSKVYQSKVCVCFIKYQSSYYFDTIIVDNIESTSDEQVEMDSLMPKFLSDDNFHLLKPGMLIGYWRDIYGKNGKSKGKQRYRNLNMAIVVQPYYTKKTYRHLASK